MPGDDALRERSRPVLDRRMSRADAIIYDKPGHLIRRLDQYLQLGIPLVWVIDPEGRFVTVYQPDEMQKTLDEKDELTGEDVLPEFRCRVGNLFAVPGASA